MARCSHSFAMVFLPLLGLLSLMANLGHRLTHTFAQNLLGALMSLADEAALKRLLFEGHTMVLSQVREAVANPEAAHTRKLPQVERNAKMVTLRAAMPGFALRSSWSPAMVCST